jgi:hypothetical protein
MNEKERLYKELVRVTVEKWEMNEMRITSLGLSNI